MVKTSNSPFLERVTYKLSSPLPLVWHPSVGLFQRRWIKLWAACSIQTSRSATDAWKDEVASPFSLHATVRIGLPSEPTELSTDGVATFESEPSWD